jgi:response regulator RpfG family c-di-GMP phosphodiesterase
MSDKSGTEFLGREKMLYPDTIRLVLSGYTDLNTVTDAINRGAIYRFLTKPWNDDELRKHIHQAFRTYEEQRRSNGGLAAVEPVDGGEDRSPLR